MANSKLSALGVASAEALQLRRLALDWRDIRDYSLNGTDDTTAIQSAIDVGPGAVFFPQRETKITGLTLGDRVTLMGSERAFSRVLQTSTAAVDAITSTTKWWGGVRNLWLIGNRASLPGAGRRGIYYNQITDNGDRNNFIDWVQIDGFSGNAIEFGPNARQGTITNLKVLNCDGDGLVLRAGATDTQIMGVEIGLVGGNGVNIESANNRLTDAKVGLIGTRSDSTTPLAGAAGFLIAASGNQLMNCSVQSCPGDALSISSFYNYAHVTVDQTQGYAVRFTGAAARNYVHVHILRGAGAAYNLTGIARFDGTSTNNTVLVSGDYQDTGFANLSSGAAAANNQVIVVGENNVWRSARPVRTDQYFTVADGVTAPSTTSGYGHIYIDAADGDLKIKFGDGTVKTIVVDT